MKCAPEIEAGWRVGPPVLRRVAITTSFRFAQVMNACRAATVTRQEGLLSGMRTLVSVLRTSPSAGLASVVGEETGPIVEPRAPVPVRSLTV